MKKARKYCEFNVSRAFIILFIIACIYLMADKPPVYQIFMYLHDHVLSTSTKFTFREKTTWH